MSLSEGNSNRLVDIAVNTSRIIGGETDSDSDNEEPIKHS
jgi:hypothetical protein